MLISSTSETARGKLLTSSMSMMIMFGGKTFPLFSATAKHIRHNRVKVLQIITPAPDRKSHELSIRKLAVLVKKKKTHSPTQGSVLWSLNLDQLKSYFSLFVLEFGGTKRKVRDLTKDNETFVLKMLYGIFN